MRPFFVLREKGRVHPALFESRIFDMITAESLQRVGKAGVWEEPRRDRPPQVDMIPSIPIGCRRKAPWNSEIYSLPCLPQMRRLPAAESRLPTPACWKQDRCEKLLDEFGKIEPILGWSSPITTAIKRRRHSPGQEKGAFCPACTSPAHTRIVPVDSCLTEDETADTIIVSIRKLLKAFKLTATRWQEGDSCATCW